MCLAFNWRLARWAQNVWRLANMLGADLWGRVAERLTAAESAALAATARDARSAAAHVQRVLRSKCRGGAGATLNRRTFVQSMAKVTGFAQHPDITPTLLGRLGLQPPKRVTGEDLWPYVTGARTNKRDHIVGQFGWLGTVRTPEWNYIGAIDPAKAGGIGPQVYDLKRDPHELHNVADQHPEVIRALDPLLHDYIDNGWEITRGSFAGRV